MHRIVPAAVKVERLIYPGPPQDPNIISKQSQSFLNEKKDDL